MVHASLRTAFQALEMGAQRTTRAARCGPRLRRLRPPSYPRVWRESRFEYRRRRILGARLAVRLMTLPLEAAVSAGDRWRGRVVLLDHSALDDDRPSDLLDLRNRISAKLARRTNAPPDPMLPLDAYLGMAKRMPHTATNDAQQPSDEVRRQATELLKQRWSQRNGSKHQAAPARGATVAGARRKAAIDPLPAGSAPSSRAHVILFSTASGRAW